MTGSESSTVELSRPMTAPRYSAADIARALGMSYDPTPEQQAVIEAPLRPLLVVAGAGSGKTETMAARVVWLVANGFVQADQVLGLTFTRKAATELAERIGQRLRRLQQVGLWTPPVDDGSDPGNDAETLGGTPTVSTYHSYAGRLVREHGLRLGYESESRLLSEAAAWQYAAEAVLAHDGPMDAVTKAESTITAAVVDLAGEMAEHLLTTTAVTDYLDRLDKALDALPQGASRAKDLPKETKAMRAALRERRAVLPIVDRYLRLKRSRDAMDFADQMALAARLAVTFADVGAIERQRFRAVLLDEFQDTSEAQLELLRALFVAPGEQVPVTAVGDPHQSIYAWRGASATTLSRYPRIFADGAPATVLPLSTSWRNDRAILDAANHVAAPLRAAATVPVQRLQPAPAARTGHVYAARLATVEEEAASVADWMVEQRRAGARSAAVLCRKRSQFAAVIDALQTRDVPVEVVGLGGLLLTPEVADLVALLHVVQDPTRGDHLMRLLTGPFCRLGAADLDGLMAWARRQQGSRQAAAGNRAGTVREQAADAVDNPSIVEALDDLPPPGWEGPDGERLSATAVERLTDLQHVVRRLRGLTGLALSDLAGEAERALGLDVEVLARPGHTPATARAHLDAFADVAAGFTASADRPTLGGFLAWLKAALDEERGLDKGYIEVSPDAVQVLTVHAAKGLEWDAVAVPGLVESSFPEHSGKSSRHDGQGWGHSSPKDRAWTSGLPGIPYDLRGDRDGLPRLDWTGAGDRKDLEDRLVRFIEDAGGHGVTEERRLAYVAFTRAKHAMLLTAPVWGDASTPRLTSRFLTEVLDGDGLVVERGEWSELPEPDAGNPRSAEPMTVLWPPERGRSDERFRRLAQAAEAVRGASVAPPAGDASASPTAPPSGAGAARAGAAGAAEPLAAEPLAAGLPASDTQSRVLLRELDLLLRERQALADRRAAVVEVPRHLSASAVVSLAKDPVRFAADLRRPMPAPPAVAARRGTAFHAWVEQHYARAAILDVLELPGSADEDPADDALLPQMKANFLASEWAQRLPSDVEIAVETVVDGIAVRGRIDAVFPRPGGGFTIVDWKTGSRPEGTAAAERALQLAAYRIAYARLRGLSLSEVDAAFFHAATGETVWPDLPGEEGLLAVLRQIPQP